MSKSNKKYNKIKRFGSLTLSIALLMSLIAPTIYASEIETAYGDNDIIVETIDDNNENIINEEVISNSDEMTIDDISNDEIIVNDSSNNNDDSNAVEDELNNDSLEEDIVDDKSNDIINDVNEDEEIPTFDHLYGELNENLDFSSKQLLVGTNDSSIFIKDTNIVSSYDDIYLLSFNSEDEAKSAYTYYNGLADFVDVNSKVYLNSDDYNTNTSINVENLDSFSLLKELLDELEKDNEDVDKEKKTYKLALIGTGVNDKNNENIKSISLVDDSGYDTSILDTIYNINNDLSILSLKVFTTSGGGYIPSVYAAIEYAIASNVEVINLPFSIVSGEEIESLNKVITKALDANITIICSANESDDIDINNSIFDNMDGIYLVGSCDENGVANNNDRIFCNVVAKDSNEASIKLSAIIASYGMDYIYSSMNNGVIFENGYQLSKNEVLDDIEIDNDINYKEYNQLVETPSTNDKLLDKSQLSQETIDILNKDIAVIVNDVKDKNALPEQTPVSGDNVTIEHIYIRWLTANSGDTTSAAFGRLELKSEIEDLSNQQFQIDFALSGQDAYKPGSIEITFPAYIWKDRNGEEYGTLTLSVPEDPETSVEFAWKRIDDKIVITNTKTIAAASKIILQGTFRNMSAPEMKDETISNPLQATITITTPNEQELVMESNAIDAHIDTSIKATYANKTAYDKSTNTFDIWWGNIPDDLPKELLPDNPEEYGYIRWYISGGASGSQPFKMYVGDSILNDEGENLYGGVMLGVSHCIESEDTEVSSNGTIYKKSTNGIDVEALIYDGYSIMPKTAYVWTAYKRSEFPEKVTHIPNTQTIKVVGWDDNEESTISASAEVETKRPTEYTFIKYWDDNNNEAEHRPSYMDIWIYRAEYSNSDPWKKVRLYQDKDALKDDYSRWIYTWSDNGQVSTFDVEEYLYNYSGVLDNQYDDEGHELKWSYYLKDKDYNMETHTWSFTNSYNEGWKGFETSKVNKYIIGNYTDSALVSKQDGLSLNQLLRGNDVYVPFKIETQIGIGIQQINGVYPNIFRLEDTEYYLNNDMSLGTEDIDIGALTMFNPILYKYIDEEDTKDGWYRHEQIFDIPEVEIYGKLNEEWIHMATYENEKLILTDNSNATLDGSSRLIFPKGTSNIRLDMESDVSTVIYNCIVELRVKPSENIINMINKAFSQNDFSRFTIFNKAFEYAIYNGDNDILYNNITYSKGDIIDIKNDWSIGYLHGRAYKVAAELTKKFEHIESNIDKIKQVERIHTTLELTQQSNITSLNDYYEAITSGEIPNASGGIFYDLLPRGIEPNLTTLTIENGSIVDSYTISNYRNSGRTMLIVKVDFVDNISYTKAGGINNNESIVHPNDATYPIEGYKNSHILEFDAFISWEAVMDSSIPLNILYNIAAFESNEDTIGSVFQWEGEPDDPTYGNHQMPWPELGMQENCDLMTDLNPNRDTNSFVYAGSYIDEPEVNITAITGIHKKVKAQTSSIWSNGEDNDVNVQEGGLYAYSITVTADVNAGTSNIILVDSLENYIPNQEDNDYQDTQWRGSLKSIDLTSIINRNVNPIIYYSTTPNLDVSTGYKNYRNTDEFIEYIKSIKDEDGNNIWSTTQPEDLSQVTAIAIDMRYNEDESSFTLQPGESFTIYLHMQAPYDKDDKNPYYFKNTDGTNHLENAHAYNNIFISCVHDNPSTYAYIDQGYTKVGIFSKHIDVEKVWNDDDDRDGIRPDEITIYLYANGEYTGKYIVLNEANNWKDKFERMLTYDEDGNYIIYTYVEKVKDESIESKGYTPSINQQLTEDGNVYVTLTNIHTPEKIEIPITKIWNDDNDANHIRPSFITFKLYADGVFTGKTLIVRAGNDGTWSGVFTGLEKYRDQGIEIKYTIEEDSIEDYVLELQDGNMENGITFTNKFYPYGNLSITKTVLDSTEEAINNEFNFALRLWYGDINDNDPVLGKFQYTIYNSEEIVSSGTIGDGDNFTLKENEKIIIKDIPTHAKYSITERTTKGYTLTGTINDSGEIHSYASSDAEFINTYETKGYATIEALKILDGRKLTSSQFRFQLLDEDGNIVGNAFNDKNGKVTFRLSYSNEDNNKEYEYTLVEYNNELSGYTYDETIYKVKVFVHDIGDGTMGCEITYYDKDDNPINIEIDDTIYDTPIFKNLYRANGEISLRAWKTIKGRDVENEEFTFNIYNQDFNFISEAKNNENAIINFDSIEFNQYDIGNSYWFYAKEVEGTDPTIIYGKDIIGYLVTVIDNGDGNLSFEQSSYVMTDAFTKCECNDGIDVTTNEKCELCKGFGYILNEEWTPQDNEVPLFTNGLVDGSLSISKYINNDDYFKEFNFKVKLIGEDIEDKKIEYDIVPADEDDYFKVNNYNSINAINSPISAINATNTINDSQESTIVESGTYANLYWKIDDNGKLIIKPNKEEPITINSIAFPWIGKTNITSAEIQGNIIIGSKIEEFPLFKKCSNLVDVKGLENINASNATSLVNMFYGCTNLTTILGMENWNTSNIRTIRAMFYNCSSLKNVDFLNNWNTQNLEIMNATFQNCTNLTSIKGIENWNVSKVTNMGNMLSNCESIENINLSNWETTSLTYALALFKGCSNLTTLDISNFDMTNVNSHKDMFNNCDNLKDVSFNSSILTKGIDLPESLKNDSDGKYILKEHADLINPPSYTYEELMEGLKNGTINANDYVWQSSSLPEKKYSNFTQMIDGEFNIALRANEKAIFNNLPAGTIYQVYEETLDGWVLVQQIDSSGIIQPLEESQAKFYNQYQPDVTTATIVGTKYLDNKLASEDANSNKFQFILIEDGKELQRVEAQVGGFIQFNPIIYDKEGTYNYEIREVIGDNVDVKYDEHIEYVTVTITKDEDDNLISKVTYDNGEIKFENYSAPGALEISKVAQNLTEQNKDQLFTFRIKLFNPNGVPVSGEQFNWYVKDSLTGEVIANIDVENESQDDKDIINDENNKNNDILKEEKENINIFNNITNYPQNIFNNVKTYVQNLWDNKINLFTQLFSNETLNNTSNINTISTINEINDYEIPILDGTEIASGTNGTAKWVIDEDGVLTIFPEKGNEGTFILDAIGQQASNWPWYNYRTQIKKIEVRGHIIIDTLNNYAASMFRDCSNLVYANLGNLDFAYDITYITEMFYNCTSLEEVDISGMNTHNIQAIYYLFRNCQSLKKIIGIDSLDTTSITNAGGMFQECFSIESLDLSNWNMSKVSNIGEMFRDCKNLTNLKVSGWNLSSCNSIANVFTGCESLKTIDASNWILSNSISSLFNDIPTLEVIDITGWDTTKTNNMTWLFADCKMLKTIIGIDEINTSNLTDPGAMFMNCSSLTSLDLSAWNMNKVNNVGQMFDNCSSLTDLNISGWNLNNVIDIRFTFRNCSSLTYIDLSGWDTSHLSRWIDSSPFEGCNVMEITIGQKLFAHKDMPILPDPSIESPYTGKWIFKEQFNEPDANPRYAFTSQELKDELRNGNAPIGTYVWEQSTYFVTFKSGANDDEITGSMSRGASPSSEDYILPTNKFVRYGYVFIGWKDETNNYEFKSVNGIATIPSGTYQNNESITLVAQWQPLDDDGKITYIIDYYWQNVNNLNEYNFYEQVINNGIPGAELSLPDKSYIGFITPKKEIISIPDNTILHLSYYYDRIKYSIHFEGNGAEFGSMDDLEMVYGLEKTFGNGYSKTSSAFLGWNTQRDGEGEWYTATLAHELDIEDINNGDVITLYAQWMELDQAIEATNGEITVQCKAGQTIVIPDLPAGTTYEIEEIDIPNGWFKVEEDGVDGIIISNSTSTSSTTNDYKPQGIATIEAHKDLVGSTLQSGQFTFELHSGHPDQADDTLLQSSTNGDIDRIEYTKDENGNEIENSHYGTAPVIFDNITFTEVGEYTYYIKEVVGDDSTINYDTHIEEVKIIVTDNGDGTLKTEVIYDPNGVSDGKALFTNSVKEGNLIISKLLDNITSVSYDQEFTFDIFLLDSTGQPLTGQYTMVKSTSIKNDTEENIDDKMTSIDVLYVEEGKGSIILKGGESIKIKGLPDGATYQIVEQEKSGFILSKSEGDIGTIIGGDDSNASFTNVYSAIGELPLIAYKTLLGSELKENQFSFNLLNENDEVLQTVYANVEDGSIIFEPIYFTDADVGKEFIYKIVEVNDGDDHITYDENQIYYYVTVKDNGDGTLSFDVISNSTTKTFINTTNHDIYVSKVVSGNAANMNEKFKFKLTLTGDNLPSSITYAIMNKEERDKFDSDEFDKTLQKEIAMLEEGTFTFELGHNETILFIALPYGIEYLVEEIDANDYRTSINGDNSGILGNEDIDIIFTNTKKGSIPTLSWTNSIISIGIILGILIMIILIIILKRKKSHKSNTNND